jgi:hypothetical protein
VAAGTILTGLLVLGSTVSAGASVPLTCTSGHTLFDRDSVRVFIVNNPGDPEALVCAAGSSSPILFDDPGPANGLQVGDFRFFGDRLGFDDLDTGLGSGGTDTGVGWVNLHTRQVREGELDGGLHENYELRGYAVAPDGATAVIADTRCETVATLSVRAHELSPPVVVFRTTNGRLAPGSLAITNTTVSWRTAGGTAGSAPLPAGTSGLTSSPGHC